MPKTASERSKLYREHKKLAAFQASKETDKSTCNASATFSQDGGVQLIQHRAVIHFPPVQSAYEATSNAPETLCQDGNIHLITDHVKMYTPTSAERSKLFQEHKKLAAQRASMEVDKATSIASAALSQEGGVQIQQSLSAADHPRPRAKTGAERAKEYRARKKMAAQQSTRVVNSAVMSDKVVLIDR